MYWFIYNILFTIGLTVMLPYYLRRMWKRGGYRRGFMQRFGVYPQAVRARLDARERIWVHAVSVGEVYVALRFMEHYRSADTAAAFVLTTNTSTGHRVAEQRVHADDVLLYFPVDLPCFVRRVLDRIRPAALVLTECELWPNLVRMAAARRVPVMLLNGRVSESSFRGYRVLRGVFRRTLRNVTGMLVQTALDAQRLIALGAPADRVHVLGTAKYDVAQVEGSRAGPIADVLRRTGWPDDALLLVGASTWPGEEEALLSVYKALRPRFDRLRLVLVPRHFERSAEVAAAIRAAGVAHARRSTIEQEPVASEPDVLLVDSTGELTGVYAHGTIVFVGKSLTNRGGQNIIEPALFGKPVLFGPHMGNFPGVVEDFLEADAAIQVADEASLQAAVERLLADAGGRAALGARAAQVVEARRGALATSVRYVREACAAAR